MHINMRSQTAKLVLAMLLLASPLVLGCAQLKPLRDQRILTRPSSNQLGVSPAARSIENSLGIE